MSQRPRVVIAVPDAAERVTLGEWLLAEGLEPVPTSSVSTAQAEMRSRPYDLLVTDASFAREGLQAAGLRRGQATRSIVVGDTQDARLEAERRGAMFVERPASRTMLVCLVAMALADQRPARRSERKPLNRFGAVVNAIPTQIVDVSSEGLRLDIPHAPGAVPPPVFHVKIPTMGLSLTVRRQWAASWPPQGRPEVVRVGVALTQTTGPAVAMWRKFVDTVPSLAVPATGRRGPGALQH